MTAFACRSCIDNRLCFRSTVLGGLRASFLLCAGVLIFFILAFTLGIKKWCIADNVHMTRLQQVFSLNERLLKPRANHNLLRRSNRYLEASVGDARKRVNNDCGRKSNGFIEGRELVRSLDGSDIVQHEHRDVIHINSWLSNGGSAFACGLLLLGLRWRDCLRLVCFRALFLASSCLVLNKLLQIFNERHFAPEARRKLL
mmetsp:Transcript_18476/g.53072  ORF Transcript_18476/g.53072 Transcript_18476/m.53072 type:complete len:200 (+) Transcript_18476:1013-1612(+)